MPTARAACHADVWRGLPCWRIALPQGDSVLLAEQGAQVLSWTAGGRERLFLSPGSAADGQTAIRGGVPICWPQFNQRGPLPKHGFARNLAWQKGAFFAAEDSAELRMHLAADAHSLALWPHPFELTLLLRLSEGRLQVLLDVFNPSETDWAFTGALHSYLRVDDVRQAHLCGLGGQAEWDALSDRTGRGAAAIALDGPFDHPFDRVYAAASQALRLAGGAQELTVSQSPTWGHTVVWNPGAAMPDLPDDTFRHMLCVEAAQVLSPVTVAAGERWVGWQQFDVASDAVARVRQ
ncbi:MAG: D-hexose-6-phosphate mutarotase [Hydrogenophaga sp.]|nr:D-hexose-6-phosphate mutarotase [Hydrogenophaga sp.]